jgi:hypothetical protein
MKRARTLDNEEDDIFDIDIIKTPIKQARSAPSKSTPTPSIIIIDDDEPANRVQISTPKKIEPYYKPKYGDEIVAELVQPAPKNVQNTCKITTPESKQMIKKSQPTTPNFSNMLHMVARPSVIHTSTKIPELHERRLSKKVTRMPKKVQDRLRRAQTERIYVIDRETVRGIDDFDGPSEKFVILGSTGNVYTCFIQEKPTCDCPDASKVSSYCSFVIIPFRAISVNIFYLFT